MSVSEPLTCGDAASPGRVAPPGSGKAVVRTALLNRLCGVADGTIIGSRVMDEPYVSGGATGGGNTWGPKGTMTKARVDTLQRGSTFIDDITDEQIGRAVSGGRFRPTDLGILVNGLLVESFPEIVSSDFTAKMESDLDKIEEGQRDWRELLGGFYGPFKDELEKARAEMRDVKREEIPTDWTCEKCGKPIVIKWGRNGSFGACQGYPECRTTMEVVKNVDGTWEKVPPLTTDETCETCGAPMTVKRGRFGSFLACTRYPECKTTKPISLGVKCPRPGCGGFIAEKRSRRGKPFYGCSNWAKKQCDFVAWDKPIPQPCPICNAKFVLKKENKSGVTLRCMECDWKSEGSDEAEGENAA